MQENMTTSRQAINPLKVWECSNIWDTTLTNRIVLLGCLAVLFFKNLMTFWNCLLIPSLVVDQESLLIHQI
jgi:hypothetical protein